MARIFFIGLYKGKNIFETLVIKFYILVIEFRNKKTPERIQESCVVVNIVFIII